MELDLNDGVDLPGLIHRGGVFFDIEGNTPEEVYKVISEKLKSRKILQANRFIQLCVHVNRF